MAEDREVTTVTICTCQQLAQVTRARCCTCSRHAVTDLYRPLDRLPQSSRSSAPTVLLRQVCAMLDASSTSCDGRVRGRAPLVGPGDGPEGGAPLPHSPRWRSRGCRETRGPGRRSLAWGPAPAAAPTASVRCPRRGTEISCCTADIRPDLDGRRTTCCRADGHDHVCSALPKRLSRLHHSTERAGQHASAADRQLWTAVRRVTASTP